MTLATRGGFLVKYPIQRKKIPIPRKSPSPKNPGDKNPQIFKKSQMPGNKNPQSLELKIPRF